MHSPAACPRDGKGSERRTAAAPRRPRWLPLISPTAARSSPLSATTAAESKEERTSSAPPLPHPDRAARPEGRGEEPGLDARQRLSSALLRSFRLFLRHTPGARSWTRGPIGSARNIEWIRRRRYCNGRATRKGPFLLGFSRLRREVSTEIARHPVPHRQFFAERAAMDADAEVRAITLRDALVSGFSRCRTPESRRRGSGRRRRCTGRG
jgi:hypothetical protein